MRKPCAECGTIFDARGSDKVCGEPCHEIRFRRQAIARSRRYEHRHRERRQESKRSERGRELGRRRMARWRRRHADKARERGRQEQARRRASKRMLRLLWWANHLEDTLRQPLEAAMQAEFQRHVDALLEKTTAVLLAEFAAGIRFVRDRLLSLAATLWLLESRGEKVKADQWLLKLLRMIASGELLPEVVERFGRRPDVVENIAKLPLEEQQIAAVMPEPEAIETFRYKRPKGDKRILHKGEAITSLAGMAAAGTPRDVVQMCLTLVEHCPDPCLAAELLKRELSTIKPAKKMRLAAVD